MDAKDRVILTLKDTDKALIFGDIAKITDRVKNVVDKALKELRRGKK